MSSSRRWLGIHRHKKKNHFYVLNELSFLKKKQPGNTNIKSNSGNQSKMFAKSRWSKWFPPNLLLRSPSRAQGTHVPSSSPLANRCHHHSHGTPGRDAEAGSSCHAVLLEHQHLELSQRHSMCPHRSPFFWSNAQN